MAEARTYQRYDFLAMAVIKAENGRKVNIPSFLVKTDDVVQVRDMSRKIQAIGDSLDAVVRRGIPQWLDLEKEKMQGVIKGVPEREDLTMPIQEQFIVELYSK